MAVLTLTGNKPIVCGEDFTVQNCEQRRRATLLCVSQQFFQMLQRSNSLSGPCSVQGGVLASQKGHSIHYFKDIPCQLRRGGGRGSPHSSIPRSYFYQTSYPLKINRMNTHHVFKNPQICSTKSTALRFKELFTSQTQAIAYTFQHRSFLKSSKRSH